MKTTQRLFTLALAPVMALLTGCMGTSSGGYGLIPYNYGLPSPETVASGQSYQRSGESFTIGSSMDDVASLMGTPSTISNYGDTVYWHFGLSSVTFTHGRVSEWANYDNNLKARWSASSPDVNGQNSELPRVYPLPSPSPDVRQIDSQVATILAGEHSDLPPAQQIQADPSAEEAEIAIKNNTQYNLTVLYSGPRSSRVVLAPQDTRTVVLKVGSYQVAATVDSTDILPFAGKDDVNGGGYDSTFYIETVTAPDPVTRTGFP
jgi:outer membrane protein assembly factor BamE (lipoprotein component of BamABCDE complex)